MSASSSAGSRAAGCPIVNNSTSACCAGKPTRGPIFTSSELKQSRVLTGHQFLAPIWFQLLPMFQAVAQFWEARMMSVLCSDCRFALLPAQADTAHRCLTLGFGFAPRPLLIKAVAQLWETQMMSVSSSDSRFARWPVQADTAHRLLSAHGTKCLTFLRQLTSCVRGSSKSSLERLDSQGL